jgi:PAS domain S-box-containing protein
MEGMDSPCPFCTNDKILGENTGRTFIEDFQNRLNQHWYHCIDKAIEWPDGRLVCYEIAVDVTEQKLAEEALDEERSLIDSAINVTEDLLFVTDLNGEVIRWNRRVSEVTGYSDRELSSMDTINLLKKEDFHLVDEGVNRLRKEGTDMTEVELVTKDGRCIPYEFIATLIRDKDGNPTGICAVGRDMTERKKAEKALRESEETYRSLVLASPDAVTSTDLEGRITYVSKRALELYGCERTEELIGKNGFELIAPEDHERATKNLEKTLTEGPIRGAEYTMLRKDGSGFTGELNVSLIRDSEGQPKSFIATTRDVTQRKLAEERLLELNRELEGYAHAVSHDLRGPLSAIMAANNTLQYMLKNPVPQDVGTSIDELAEIIDKNLKVQGALIEDLLVLAEAGQTPSEFFDVSVGMVVYRVLTERAEIINKRGVKMDVDDDLGHVSGNPTHIYQLFSNLVANAIKHNDSKKPVVKVSYLGDDESGGHRYLVRDNGSGVPPEELDQIFGPFFKGKTGETGIGLAIVDKIVGVYSGTIKAYNDNGACFEFTLMDAHE